MMRLEVTVDVSTKFSYFLISLISYFALAISSSFNRFSSFATR